MVIRRTTSTAAAISSSASTCDRCARPRLGVSGLGNAQRATPHVRPIHPQCSFLGCFRGCHDHERKTAGTTRFAIAHNFGVGDFSPLRERLFQNLSGNVFAQISDVKSTAHVVSSRRLCLPQGLVPEIEAAVHLEVGAAEAARSPDC